MRAWTVALAKHLNVRKAKRWQVCYRDGNSKRKSRFFVSRAKPKATAAPLRAAFVFEPLTSVRGLLCLGLSTRAVRL